MDRFIGISENDFVLRYDYLKSNMDRFIEKQQKNQKKKKKI